MVAWVIVAVAVAGRAVAADEVGVGGEKTGERYTLQNGLIVVTFDGAGGTLVASAGGGASLSDGKFGQDVSKVELVEVGGAMRGGRAVELTRADHSVRRVALYPGVPFVVFGERLAAGGTNRVIGRTTPVSVSVLKGRALADLRVLGCDGLTAADEARASYAFLAAADPKTRGGVVAGWLTDERGSGIVRSKAGEGGLTIEGQVDYGKLNLGVGETAEGELFAVGHFDDCLRGLEAYADAVAKANSVKLKPAPSGYCTWYSKPHGGAADEKSLAELAAFAHDKLGPFGFNLVQIDDHWQVLPRDYTTYKPKGPYPSGMKGTAETLNKLGMTAGLWFIPFGWDPKSETFKDHQDYFVHRPDGSLYEVKWAGTCLDMTHPGARGLLEQTVSRMTHEWGYRYLKIDGLWTGLAVDILYPKPEYRDDKIGTAVFHDPRKTNVEAYRDGLRLVRKAAGADVFIDGCNVAQNMRTLAASYGLVDAMRVGRDIGASWEKILPSMTMATRLYFYNGRVWHNDPDCLMLREPLTLEQARAWGSWIAISGQLNLVSEWLPGLPADRLEIVKRTMPGTGLCGRPIDLFEAGEHPRVWQLTSGKGEDRRDVVALFNWDAKEAATIEVPLERLDLPAGGRGAFVGFDYWANRFVAPVTGSLRVTLPPASCRVISLRPAADRPVVVGTSRHVTQGVIDLRDESWDGETKSLRGRSRVVGDDPYQIRIAAPKGMQIIGAEVSEEERAGGVAIMVEDSGETGRVTVRSPAGREVHWAVRYR